MNGEMIREIIEKVSKHAVCGNVVEIGEFSGHVHKIILLYLELPLCKECTKP